MSLEAQALKARRCFRNKVPGSKGDRSRLWTFWNGRHRSRPWSLGVWHGTKQGENFIKSTVPWRVTHSIPYHIIATSCHIAWFYMFFESMDCLQQFGLATCHFGYGFAMFCMWFEATYLVYMPLSTEYVLPFGLSLFASALGVFLFLPVRNYVKNQIRCIVNRNTGPCWVRRYRLLKADLQFSGSDPKK